MEILALFLESDVLVALIFAITAVQLMRNHRGVLDRSSTAVATSAETQAAISAPHVTRPIVTEADMPEDVLQLCNLQSEDWARADARQSALQLYDSLPVDLPSDKRWARVRETIYGATIGLTHEVGVKS